MSHSSCFYIGSVILALTGISGLTSNADLDKASAAKPAAPGSETRVESLDLLSLIDLKRDRLSGGWSFKEGGLWMTGGHRSKLVLPVAPKVNYDLHVEFTMKAGHQFGIMLPTMPGVTLLWIGVAAKGAKDRVGLGKYYDAAPYLLKKTPSRRLVKGRKCMSIRVETVARNTVHISVVLDDERILEWRGAKDSLTVNPDYAMPNEPLGLTNWGTTVLFHELKLRLVPATASRK